MPDPEFILLGDALWLDFVNTARGRTVDAPDRLADHAAYHRWTKAQKLPSDGDGLGFEAVLRLRQRLTLLAESLDAGRQPPASAVEAINDVLARLSGHNQLTRIAGVWRLRFAPLALPTALDAVVRSAADTLADVTLRVRQCAAPACTLLFVDGAAAGNRRWCSQDACAKHVVIERRRGLLR